MRAARSEGNDATRIKVSVQYRTKRGKVYELTRGVDVLAVSISPPEFADSGQWHVEARLGAGPSDPLADGWGATATAALTATARAWSEYGGLTVFDWDAVARELHGVNAV